MAKNKNTTISPETQDEALAVAKKTNKPGQKKEQTQLIALGIQKGIAEYKKMAKIKQREADKASKKNKNKETSTAQQLPPEVIIKPQNKRLPWFLLAFSWIAFAGYFIIAKQY